MIDEGFLWKQNILSTVENLKKLKYEKRLKQSY